MWENYLADPSFRKVFTELLSVKGDSEQHSIFAIQEDGSMSYESVRGKRICLPLSRVQETLKISHDVLGHFGIEKTNDRISSIYYRPGLSSAVTAYVKHCPNCAKNKTSRLKRQGSLSPIDLLLDGSRILKAFESINMDIIVGLPKSVSYDTVLTIIYQFTRTGFFIPTTSNFTAATIANIFLEKDVSKGFLPLIFITDRDPHLIQLFWQTHCARLRINDRKTAAFHIQMDRAAERLNQTLEMALRSYVAPRQNELSNDLHLLELAYHTAKNSSTRFTPYKLLYAQPQNPVERIWSSNLPVKDNINENYASSDCQEPGSKIDKPGHCDVTDKIEGSEV